MTSDTTTSAAGATFRRSFGPMDWQEFVALTMLFCLAAKRADSPILHRVAASLCDQLAGKCGAREFTDFAIDFSADSTDELEELIKQLMLLGLYLQGSADGLSFLTGLGEAAQATFAMRRNLRVPIDMEHTGQQPN